MSLLRFTRTPLGARYRSKLGVFGPLPVRKVIATIVKLGPTGELLWAFDSDAGIAFTGGAAGAQWLALSGGRLYATGLRGVSGGVNFWDIDPATGVAARALALTGIDVSRVGVNASGLWTLTNDTGLLRVQLRPFADPVTPSAAASFPGFGFSLTGVLRVDAGGGLIGSTAPTSYKFLRIDNTLSVAWSISGPGSGPDQESIALASGGFWYARLGVFGALDRRRLSNGDYDGWSAGGASSLHPALATPDRIYGGRLGGGTALVYVSRSAPSGTVPTAIGPAMSVTAPHGLAVDNDGNVAVSALVGGVGKVMSLAPDGTIRWSVNLSAFAVAVDPATGAVYAGIRRSIVAS